MGILNDELNRIHREMANIADKYFGEGEKMRLIDADKLRKDILDLPNCYNGYSDAYDKAYIIDVIDEQQTVVAKVLRCKDCRWYENDGFHTNCKIMQFCVEAEDYCSRWERREDAKTD